MIVVNGQVVPGLEMEQLDKIALSETF
jgi:hypothetical protein